MHCAVGAPPNLRTALFADDVTLFPQDERDARGMLGVVREFGHASGSALNEKKSMVVFSLATKAVSFAGLHVVRPGEEVKSLGMVYGPDISPADQWLRIAAQMKKMVRVIKTMMMTSQMITEIPKRNFTI